MTDNTPLNADDELREKLNSLFESVFSQGVRAGKDVATETYEDFDAWHKKGELDEAMQLITADRKRVALEGRIDELKHLVNDDGIWYQDMTRQFPQKITLNQRIKELESWTS